MFRAGWKLDIPESVEDLALEPADDDDEHVSQPNHQTAKCNSKLQDFWLIELKKNRDSEDFPECSSPMRVSEVLSFRTVGNEANNPSPPQRRGVFEFAFVRLELAAYGTWTTR